MAQEFEVFKGDPKSLKARLDVIKASGNTGIVVEKTSASAAYIITYTSTGVDADYTALLARGTTLGYSLPSAGQQILQNDLVVALKAAGIWTKLDVFYVFANDGSSQFATLNWISPLSNQCTLVNAPAWVSDQGYKGNASNAHINTNFNISTATNYTQNNASRFAWVNTAFTVNGVIWGVFSSSRERGVNANNAGVRINQGTTVSPAGIDFTGTGLMHSNREAAGTATHYKNGGLVQTSAIASEALLSETTTLLVSGLVWGDPELSVFGSGAGLAAESGDLYNAINTYMTSI